MRETRARKREGVKWYEAKPAMDVDDFRRLLARKAQADAENETLQRAEEAEAAAELAAQAEHTARPAAEHEHANGAVPMETGSDDAAAEDAAAAAAAALAASAAQKQQEADALEKAAEALRVRCGCASALSSQSAYPTSHVRFSGFRCCYGDTSRTGPWVVMQSALRALRIRLSCCLKVARQVRRPSPWCSLRRCRAQEKQEAKRQRHEVRERLRQLKAREHEQRREQRTTERMHQRVRCIQQG